MDLGGQVGANKTDVPGLVFVASLALLVFLVANYKAVFVGIGGQPLALRSVGKTGVDLALATVRLQVGGQPGLVLAMAGTGAGGVGRRGSLAGHKAVMDGSLVSIRTITAGQH